MSSSLTQSPVGPSPLGPDEAPLEFGHSDRLGLSFFGSILLHMVIILGVTFAIPQLREIEGLPTMEITLVQTQTDLKPDDAEYLAQANQEGGGTTDQPETARNPLPITEVGEQNRVPALEATPQKRVLSKQERQELLTQDKSRNKVQQAEAAPDERRPRFNPFNPGMLQPQEMEQERARLNAQLSRQWQELQQLPKRKYVNARTREYKYANYMVAWQAKVERVGNLNYPEEARRRGLSGDLILDVVLQSDGGLYEVNIVRSSGHPLLDDAAMRIVALAAPYSPFPDDIKAETDLLHITRTWKFNEQGWQNHAR